MTQDTKATASQPMTRWEFEAFLYARGIRVPVEQLQKCTCGDVNCHGWRIVR